MFKSSYVSLPPILSELQVADGGGSSRGNRLFAVAGVCHDVDRAYGLDRDGRFDFAHGKLIRRGHLSYRLRYESVGIRFIQQVPELQISHVLSDNAVDEAGSLDAEHTPDQQVVRVHVIVDYLHSDD